jgi:hypothetical protein
VRQRVLHKVCMMAYHLYHQTPYYPSYFNATGPRSCLVTTRSLSIPQLSCSFKPKLKSYGDRAFHSAAASCFNSLPPSVRLASSYSSFKQLLKTFLFTTIT